MRVHRDFHLRNSHDSNLPFYSNWSEVGVSHHIGTGGWSSYRALAGLGVRLDWLDVQSVHDQIAPGKRAAVAASKYAEFVAQGKGVQLWDEHLKQQIYLGDDAFIVRMQELAGIGSTSLESGKRGETRRRSVSQKSNVSRIHTAAPVRDDELKRYAAMKTASKDHRNQNIADAFYQGGHTQTAIAQAFGLSTSTVSRVVAEFEREIAK